MSKKDKSSLSRNLTIRFEVPAYQEYQMPHGYLVDDPACSALWFYYTRARLAYEQVEKDPIVYEGDKDPIMDLMKLFQNTGLAYGVQPERMLHFWSAVNMQRMAMGLPDLPEKYKFNKIPDIRTQ